jgi:uncharacterized protein (DUF488 family)
MRDRAHLPVYTLGHSTRSLEELIDVLHAYRIRVLVDIRTIRRSRKNPQFNEEVLERALAEASIEYVALDALGGLRGRRKREGPPRNDAWEVASFRNYADYAETDAFREGLARLLRIAARKRTVIMCAEAVWWRCHRRIVADHLLARGVPVVHIFTATHAEPATKTPFAVVSRGTVHYPRRRALDARAP